MFDCNPRDNPYSFLIVVSGPLGGFSMLIISWFARLARGWPAAGTAAPSPASSGNVAANLLQSADSLAGYAPHEAQTLRDAAHAWLRVVR